jgi:hypothetical protein
VGKKFTPRPQKVISKLVNNKYTVFDSDYIIQTFSPIRDRILPSPCLLSLLFFHLPSLNQPSQTRNVKTLGYHPKDPQEVYQEKKKRPLPPDPRFSSIPLQPFDLLLCLAYFFRTFFLIGTVNAELLNLL